MTSGRMIVAMGKPPKPGGGPGGATGATGGTGGTGPVSGIPVVQNASFTLTNVVGAMSASNGPTAWQITAGNDGSFAINNSGVISTVHEPAAGKTYSLTVAATNSSGTGTGMGTIIVTRDPVAQTGFPGQPGFPVGHAATPASAPSGFIGTWPGAWPGHFSYGREVAGGTSYSTATLAAANVAGMSSGGLIINGTLGSPTIIAFVDFDVGFNSLIQNWITSDGTNMGTMIGGLQHITFVGCRFARSWGNTADFINNTSTSQDINCVKCDQSGADDIKFFYCTFCPSPQVVTSPPGGFEWPSRSVGTGYFTPITGAQTNSYQIN